MFCFFSNSDLLVNLLIILISICLSILLPLSIFGMRQSIKTRRQEAIKDFSKVFCPKDVNSGEWKIVPSFEFVKYKYFLSKSGNEIENMKDFPFISWVLSAIPLVIILLVANFFATAMVIRHVVPTISNSNSIIQYAYNLFFEYINKSADLATIWLVIVAFFAGYMSIIRNLLRSVQTFDLAPESFISAAIHLFSAIAISSIIITAISLDNYSEPLSPIAIVASAFIIGFAPELGIRAIFRWTNLLRYKREDAAVYSSFKSTPIEIIDGIDYEIRARLSQYNISSVQSLAMANPIMLFVETPYGIYQTIDWVAQAQLCMSVGPGKLTRLWGLGIRTIFDLERLSEDESPGAVAIRERVGEILLLSDEISDEKFSKNEKQIGMLDGSILAILDIKMDEIHVQRLRQIWNYIESQLGDSSKHLIPFRSARSHANKRIAAAQ